MAIIQQARRDNSEPAHTINGGVTYLLADNLQYDVNAGGGLNGRAEDFFIGTGFAWRWVAFRQVYGKVFGGVLLPALLLSASNQVNAKR